MTVTVIGNQSLLDIAIQEYGSALSIVDLALANSISITEKLVPGQKLVLPISSYTNSDIVNYFKGKNQKIATVNMSTETVVPNYLLPNIFPILL
jgi:hypothetical protein